MAGTPSPAAARASRRRWGDPRLALGLGVISVCCLVGARTLAAADESVSVWAARTALQPGQSVAVGDLVRRDVRFDGQGDADHYLSAGTGLPGDARVDRAVGPGELLPRSALGSAAAGPATEVPLSVGAQALPSDVRIGSTVDVWVTPQTGAGSAGPARRSTLVLRDVRVLAVPEAGTSLGPAEARHVTVGVDDAQSAGLPRSIAALASGAVTLTTRR